MFSALPGYEQIAGGSIDANPLWSNVVLAMHGDGTNGSTTLVDEKGHTITRLGSPTPPLISTAQSKFGGASIAFSGDGGFTIGGNTHNADFDFGTGDFLFRGFVYQTTTGASQSIFDCRNGASSSTGFVLFLNAGKLWFYQGTAPIYSATVDFPVSQQVHLELSRFSGSDYLFQDGAMLVAGASDVSNYSDGRCYIGEANAGGGGGFQWTGYMDELQVAKQHLHSSAFTPPSTAFPNF